MSIKDIRNNSVSIIGAHQMEAGQFGVIMGIISNVGINKFSVGDTVMCAMKSNGSVFGRVIVNLSQNSVISSECATTLLQVQTYKSGTIIELEADV